jgi:hypothetical protein
MKASASSSDFSACVCSPNRLIERILPPPASSAWYAKKPRQRADLLRERLVDGQLPRSDLLRCKASPAVAVTSELTERGRARPRGTWSLAAHHAAVLAGRRFESWSQRSLLPQPVSQARHKVGSPRGHKTARPPQDQLLGAGRLRRRDRPCARPHRLPDRPGSRTKAPNVELARGSSSGRALAGGPPLSTPPSGVRSSRLSLFSGIGSPRTSTPSGSTGRAPAERPQAESELRLRNSSRSDRMTALELLWQAALAERATESCFSIRIAHRASAERRARWTSSSCARSRLTASSSSPAPGPRSAEVANRVRAKRRPSPDALEAMSRPAGPPIGRFRDESERASAASQPWLCS